MNNPLTFRYAGPNDTALILQFIRELADYEDMSGEVVADEDICRGKRLGDRICTILS